MHVDATELLVCNIDSDVLKHRDNLATYDHNDITGVLIPALPPLTLLLTFKIIAKLSTLTREVDSLMVTSSGFPFLPSPLFPN